MKLNYVFLFTFLFLSINPISSAQIPPWEEYSEVVKWKDKTLKKDSSVSSIHLDDMIRKISGGKSVKDKKLELVGGFRDINHLMNVSNKSYKGKTGPQLDDLVGKGDIRACLEKTLREEGLNYENMTDEDLAARAASGDRYAIIVLASRRLRTEKSEVISKVVTETVLTLWDRVK